MRPIPDRGRKSGQAGSFLLEALIAILIVALGVLGSVGLLGHSMQEIDDARNRGEAAFLANQLIGQMWVSNRVTATLQANYSSVPGTGQGYTDFLGQINARMPNSNNFAQVVTIVPGPNNGVNGTNSIVTVIISWVPPYDCKGAGCSASPPHVYRVRATIGANQ